MKIDVIDCRGFVKTPPYQDVCSGKKLGSQPLSNNAQTAPSSVSGQGCVKDIQKSRSLGVQPLKPLKGVNNVDKVHL